MPQYNVEIAGKVNRSFPAAIERLKDRIKQLSGATKDTSKATVRFGKASGTSARQQDALARQVQRTAQRMEQHRRVQERMNSSLSNSRRLLAGVAAVMTGTLAVAVTRSLDTFTSLRNRLVAVGTGGDEARAVIDRLAKTASLTGTNIAELGGAFSRFKIALSDTDATAKEITNIIDSLAKSSAALGLEASEVNAGILQLGQAMASGRLQGDEYRSVAETLPVLMKAIQLETGKSAAELKEFGSQGKITTAILRASLLRFGKDAELQFANFQQTIGGALNAVRTSAARLIDDLARRFGVGGIADLIQRAAVAVDNFRKSLADADSTAARVISGTFNALIAAVNTMKLGFNSLRLAITLAANTLAGLIASVAEFSLEPMRQAFQANTLAMQEFAAANQTAAARAQAAWSAVGSAISGAATPLPALPDIAQPAAAPTAATASVIRSMEDAAAVAERVTRESAAKATRRASDTAKRAAKATRDATTKITADSKRQSMLAARQADMAAQQIGNSMTGAIADIVDSTNAFGRTWSSVMRTAITEIGRLIVQQRILQGVQAAATLSNPTTAAISIGSSVLSAAIGSLGLTGGATSSPLHRPAPITVPPRPQPLPQLQPQRQEVIVHAIVGDEQIENLLSGKVGQRAMFNNVDNNADDLRRMLGVP